MTLKIVYHVILTNLNISAPFYIMKSGFSCRLSVRNAWCSVYSRFCKIGNYTTTVSERCLGEHVNSSRSIARELLCKQVPVEMNAHPTIEKLLFLLKTPSLVTTQYVYFVCICGLRQQISCWTDFIHIRY